jgi:hypothetical protein
MAGKWVVGKGCVVLPNRGMKRKSHLHVSCPAPPPPPAYPRMVALLSELARGEGFCASRLPGVRFMRAPRHVPRSPIAYEPSIVIVCQGRKMGYLGGRTFVYDANHYLVLSVPLPFECETEGSGEEPLLGVSISVTPAMVTELLMQMGAAQPLNGPRPQPMLRRRAFWARRLCGRSRTACCRGI